MHSDAVMNAFGLQPPTFYEALSRWKLFLMFDQEDAWQQLWGYGSKLKQFKECLMSVNQAYMPRTTAGELQSNAWDSIRSMYDTQYFNEIAQELTVPEIDGRSDPYDRSAQVNVKFNNGNLQCQSGFGHQYVLDGVLPHPDKMNSIHIRILLYINGIIIPFQTDKVAFTDLQLQHGLVNEADEEKMAMRSAYYSQYVDYMVRLFHNKEGFHVTIRVPDGSKKLYVEKRGGHFVALFNGPGHRAVGVDEEVEEFEEDQELQSLRLHYKPDFVRGVSIPLGNDVAPSMQVDVLRLNGQSATFLQMAPFPNNHAEVRLATGESILTPIRYLIPQHNDADFLHTQNSIVQISFTYCLFFIVQSSLSIWFFVFKLRQENMLAQSIDSRRRAMDLYYS